MNRITIGLFCFLSLVGALSAATPGTPAPAPGDAPASWENTQVITEGIISAPCSEVWRIFSTAEGFKSLGVAQAKMDFRVGGLILSSYDPKATLGDKSTIQTEIVAYEPGRLLVTRIQHPPKGFPFTNAFKHVWSVISLADLGDNRTQLRISMNGYGPDEESQKMRAFFTTGNDWVLKKLQAKYGDAPAPTGPAHAESPLGAIELTRVVPGAREDVWKALATAAGWKAFFGADSRIGVLPGESFEPFQGTEGCRLLTVVPNEVLSFTWNAPPKFPFAREHPTWVIVQLDELSPGTTRVRLRHLGFAEQAAAHADHAREFEEARAYFTSAWPKVLTSLAAHFGRS